MERTFTTAEAAAAIGLATPRRVAAWCEHRMLRPIDTNPGKGVDRRFEYAEVVKAGIIVEAQRLFGPKFLPSYIAVPLKTLSPLEPTTPPARRVWPRFTARPREKPLFLIIDDLKGAGVTQWWWPTGDEPQCGLDELGSVALVVNVDRVKAKIEANLSK
jgi:hypothetical protein